MSDDSFSAEFDIPESVIKRPRVDDDIKVRREAVADDVKAIARVMTIPSARLNRLVACMLEKKAGFESMWRTIKDPNDENEIPCSWAEQQEIEDIIVYSSSLVDDSNNLLCDHILFGIESDVDTTEIDLETPMKLTNVFERKKFAHVLTKDKKTISSEKIIAQLAKAVRDISQHSVDTDSKLQ